MRALPLVDNSPLTAGLVDVVLPVGGVMMSLAGTLAQQAFVDNNALTMGFVKSQKAIAKSYVAASNQYSLRSGVPAPFNLTGNTLKEVSALVVWTTPASVVTNGTVFGYGNSASANPFLQMAVGSTGGFGFFLRGTTGTGQLTQGTAPISANTDYCIIGTHSESNSYHRTYINGTVDINTTATAVLAATLDRATVGALQRITLTQACGGQIALCLVWARALTPTEVAALTADPWQVFSRPVSRVRADIVSSGPAVHPSTGALVGGGAVVAGTARRTRAHPTSGALVGAGATVAGTAAHTSHGTHPASGALAGGGAAVAGTAAHVAAHVTHPSTGALAGSGAVVAGTAAHVAAPVTHTASGALNGGGARITGQAARPSGFDAGLPLTRREADRIRAREKRRQAEIDAAWEARKRDQGELRNEIAAALRGPSAPAVQATTQIVDDQGEDSEDADLEFLLLHG